jgi:hypothetical protein
MRARLQSLEGERQALEEIRKTAFMASPPMPQGATPPMDPASQGAPPVDPATGMPMDPAMMGAPPMDPSMAQGGMPPVDPATGMPMDPAAMGAPAEAPAITPEIVDQILGLLEEMGQGMEGLKQQVTALQQGTEVAIQEMGDQIMELDKAVAGAAGVAADAAPAAQKAPAW